MIGLRWDDIDLDGRQVVIAHTVTDVGGELVTGTTKSHRSRPVGLDDHLVAVLRRHRAAQAEWRLLVGPGWVDRGLVFPAPDGDYLRPATLTQQFDRLVASAGVPRIRLHDLRHTHASLLVEAGRNPKLVSERLGHRDVAFTLNRYVKVSTEQQIEAANDFTRRLRGTVTAKPAFSTTATTKRGTGTEEVHGRLSIDDALQQMTRLSYYLTPEFPHVEDEGRAAPCVHRRHARQPADSERHPDRTGAASATGGPLPSLPIRYQAQPAGSTSASITPARSVGRVGIEPTTQGL